MMKGLGDLQRRHELCILRTVGYIYKLTSACHNDPIKQGHSLQQGG